VKNEFVNHVVPKEAGHLTYSAASLRPPFFKHEERRFMDRLLTLIDVDRFL